MALSLVVAGIDDTAKIKSGSMSLKWNTFDFTLIDQLVNMSEAVVLTTPSWSGTVVSLTYTNTFRSGGVSHFEVAVTATNATAVPGAGAAPFNLSYVPNGTTLFGFEELTVTNTSNADTSSHIFGSCRIWQPGLTIGMGPFGINNGGLAYISAGLYVTNVTTTWTDNGTPSYVIEFTDSTSQVVIPLTGLYLQPTTAFPTSPAIGHHVPRSDI